jgi:hypothetical protein
MRLRILAVLALLLAVCAATGWLILHIAADATQ